MKEWLGATDCRVCAAMRERYFGFLGAGLLSFVEAAAWIAGALLLADLSAAESAATQPWSVLAGLAVAAILLRVVRLGLLTRIALWLDHRLAPGLFERGVQARLRGHNYGLEVAGDLATFRDFLASRACARLYDLLFVPLAVAAGFWIDLRLGLALLAGSFVCAVLLVVTARAIRQPVSLAGLNAMVARQKLEDAHRNAEDVEAMGAMGPLARNWSSHNDQQLGLRQAVQRRMAWITGVAGVVSAGSLVAGLFLILAAPASGASSAGLGLAAVLLWARSVRPMEQALGWWGKWRLFRNALARLKAFAMAPPYRGDPIAPGEDGSGLRVERVHFALSEGASMLLREIDLHLAPGDSLGIIGPSGAGKSTLARLLAGVAAPTTGSVRLDGADLFAIDREAIGGLVGYMREGAELFDASLAENIARMGEVDLNKVVDAGRLAGIHETIATQIPGGYEFGVGPQGERLSAGIRQRVALARAVYGRPRLLILDEPNSNLDGEGELALFEAMDRLRKAGTIVILVTQKPASLSHVDQVLMLRDGQIEAFGPTREVLDRLSGQAPESGKRVRLA